MAKKAAVEANGENGTISKTDAIKAAINEGLDAPAEIVEYVKKKYNIELGKDEKSAKGYVSTIKSKMKQGSVRKVNAKKAITRTPRVPRKPQVTGTLATLQSVSALADEVGGLEALGELVQTLVRMRG